MFRRKRKYKNLDERKETKTDFEDLKKTTPKGKKAIKSQRSIKDFEKIKDCFKETWKSLIEKSKEPCLKKIKKSKL